MELLIDFYDYDIYYEGKNIILRNKDETLEKSVQLGYIMQKMQVFVFDRRYSGHKEYDCLETISRQIVQKLGNKIGKRVGNELLTRYIFEIPTVLLKKMSEQNIEGKVQFYKEEGVELEHFF